MVDVQGVCKSTVVRGEDGFPSGTLRVSDCHGTVVYALAPLQFASVFACSDCTVVLGAVGRMVRKYLLCSFGCGTVLSLGFPKARWQRKGYGLLRHAGSAECVARL